MDDTAAIHDKIRYERARKGPPEGFPRFPDLPGKRYTDRRFYELERLWEGLADAETRV